MTYSNPGAVSRSKASPDSLMISFDNSIFTDPDSNVEINSGEALLVKLPSQINAEEAAAIGAAMGTATSSANTFASGSMALNIVLGASLKFLWGMINTLQFVVFFTEWTVRIPPNATIAI